MPRIPVKRTVLETSGTIHCHSKLRWRAVMFPGRLILLQQAAGNRFHHIVPLETSPAPLRPAAALSLQGDMKFMAPVNNDLWVCRRADELQ